jgi:hypothetical protein
MTEVDIKFLNFEMGQNSLAVPTVDKFIRSIEPPTQIIEIGTGVGGFSVFLYLSCLNHMTEFVTYDINPTRLMYRGLFNKLNIDYRVADVFGEAKETIINTIQQKGTTVLFCDGGNKIKEFNTFAPYLKKGDYILAHDYAYDKSAFDDYIKGKYWNDCEITLADISSVVDENNLKPFMNNQWWKCAWTCWVKDIDTI